MAEMKDSGIKWIGEIPSDWRIAPLKYSYSVIAGATPDSTDRECWDGEITWITPADYKTNDVYVSGGSRTISEKGYRSCSTNILPVGSIVFSKRAPIGSVAINAVELCTNQGCLGLVNKHDSVVNKYYYYVLSIYTDVFNLFGSGTTFKEISANIFSNIKMPCPSLDSQKIIANFLDSKCAEIDSLSADIQKQIDTLEEYKRSVITEAVTKGLDPDVEIKESGIAWIGQIAAGRELSRIKFFYQITLGKMVDSKQYSDDEMDHYLCAANIKWNGVNTSVERLMRFSASEKAQYLLEIGDVLVMEGGATAGITCVYDDEFAPCYIQNSVLRCRGIKGNSNKYLYYWMYFAYFSGYRDMICNGATFYHYTKEKVAATPIVMPSIGEQHCIVAYLDSKCAEIDAAIDLKKKQLTTLDGYKKSLIYEYVTGKKEVPNE